MTTSTTDAEAIARIISRAMLDNPTGGTSEERAQKRRAIAAEYASIIAEALTAPGATTKSDGGAKAGSSPVLASKEEQRSDTHGMMPVGDNAAYVGSTGVGPSDLKTPPELLALIERAKNHVMTPEEIHEQRRSFARGMCPSHRDYKERCEQIDKLMPPLRPSDPSSTRSEVTVESIAYPVRVAILERYSTMNALTREAIGDAAAEALLDQFEIRRK